MQTTNNNSTGSLFVGQNLPEKFRKQGKVEGLSLVIGSEQGARKITYIMGSASKGWHVVTGGKPLPKGQVEFELVEE